MSKKLDTNAVNTLGELFSSKARVNVLYGLCLLTCPVGLRKLAWICQLHPRSVELALQKLVEEAMVKRLDSGKHPQYLLNDQHPEAVRLQNIFKTDTATYLKSRIPALNERASGLLAFLDDGWSLWMKGRASLHADK